MPPKQYESKCRALPSEQLINKYVMHYKYNKKTNKIVDYRIIYFRKSFDGEHNECVLLKDLDYYHGRLNDLTGVVTTNCYALGGSIDNDNYEWKYKILTEKEVLIECL